MFADNNLESIRSNLELVLTNAHKWLVKKTLHLNVSKTKCMLSGTHKMLNISPKMSVMLNATELEWVQQYNYLGLLFDPALTWGKHAEVLSHNIPKRLGVFWRVRGYLDRRVSSMINSY